MFMPNFIDVMDKLESLELRIKRIELDIKIIGQIMNEDKL